MNRRREPFFITLANSIFSFSDAFTEIVYVCFGGDAKKKARVRKYITFFEEHDDEWDGKFDAVYYP